MVPRSPRAGRWAIVRWAWRMFRRDWRQHALVLSLVTVAVAAALAGTAMVVGAADVDHGLGDANALVRIDAADPDADATVAALRDRFGAADVVRHELVTVPGFVQRLDLRSFPAEGTFTGPLLDLRDGRLPTADDEIALTPFVLDELDAGIGDEVDVDGSRWSVVGEVENPDSLGDDFAVLSPDSTHAFDSLVVLVDRFATGPQALAGERLPSFGIEAVGDDDAAIAAIVLVVVALAMALTALVAAAGFVVVAQRRQRQLGLLAALGATERHLRLVMVANGVLVGVVGAVAGSVLGFAVWLAAVPSVEQAARQRLDRLALPWGLLATVLVLGVLASTAAAWWPARSMARMPVVEALARRPRPPVPVHRSLTLAVLVAGGGVVAIGGADPMGEVRPPLLIAGVVAVIVGVVLLAPAAIRLASLGAARLPLAPRLALRDLARYQGRAASALGAIALGLGVSVGVVVLARANTDRADEGNLSDHQLVLQSDGSDAPPAELDAAAAEAGDVLATSEVVPLAHAADPGAAEERPVPVVEVVFPVGDGGFRGVDRPFVATPEVLAHAGLAADDVEPGTDLLAGSDRDDIELLDPATRPVDPTGDGDPGVAATIQRVELSPFDSAPQSLITESAMAEHGWVAVPSGYLLETDHPITDDEVDAVRAIAADVGMAVERRNDDDSLRAVSTAATVVGVVLALAIVAMAISLLRTESAQDVRTLTATGASGRTRRALTATTAGTLAALGAGLGLLGAYAAMVAAYRDELERLAPVPVSDLLTIAIGMPVAATAAGWLLAGREPATFSRQAPD